MSTLKHTCMKTGGGGPYIFRIIEGFSLMMPISLRGPLSNTQWAGEDEEDCIENLKKVFPKHEIRSFDTWQEMLQWAMNDPYLENEPAIVYTRQQIVELLGSSKENDTGEMSSSREYHSNLAIDRKIDTIIKKL